MDASVALGPSKLIFMDGRAANATHIEKVLHQLSADLATAIRNHGSKLDRCDLDMLEAMKKAILAIGPSDGGVVELIKDTVRPNLSFERDLDADAREWLNELPVSQPKLENSRAASGNGMLQQKTDVDDVLREHGADKVRRHFDADVTAKPTGTADSSQTRKTPPAVAKSTTVAVGDPCPLPDVLLPVMSFNLDLIPVKLRAWVRDVSERMQAPPPISPLSVP